MHTSNLYDQLIAYNPNCFERSSTAAHFTASCWLLNKAGDKALLLHHKKLDRWFQLGGHADTEIQQNHESNELRWIGKALEDLPTQNESVFRMFRKWIS